jgi:hypothetical protein
MLMLIFKDGMLNDVPDGHNLEDPHDQRVKRTDCLGSNLPHMREL